MRLYLRLFLPVSLLIFCSCNAPPYEDAVVKTDTSTNIGSASDTGAGRVKDSLVVYKPKEGIDTKNVDPGELLQYASSLIGVPYLYASSDPAKGLDCSGFITYVFNHFNISVPRSSVDFTNVGATIPQEIAKPGDLILFTGTDSTINVVGHMGIVVNNVDTLRFIHSTSGKANGVTVSPLSVHYKKRFVKVIRIFEPM